MKNNLEVALDVLADRKVKDVKPVRDTRQVSPGALVVDIKKKTIYLCVRHSDDAWYWELVDVVTGEPHGARYNGSPDCGLPLDRFISEVDPERYVVVYRGKVSNELAGCSLIERREI